MYPKYLERLVFPSWSWRCVWFEVDVLSPRCPPSTHSKASTISPGSKTWKFVNWKFHIMVSVRGILMEVRTPADRSANGINYLLDSYSCCGNDRDVVYGWFRAIWILWRRSSWFLLGVSAFDINTLIHDEILRYSQAIGAQARHQHIMKIRSAMNHTHSG